MIEESGRVVALAPGAVWVETERNSTCSGCSVRGGCGQGLVERLGIRNRRGLILALSDHRLARNILGSKPNGAAAAHGARTAPATRRVRNIL